MLYMVTGNNDKFKDAYYFLSQYGIEIEQKILDIPEIQSESIEKVAIDKAQKAFDCIKQPLFINDSGWKIPSLNGFPGPYMKYINNWFTADDFLALMRDKQDRTIVLEQVYVYRDAKETKVFIYEYNGTILEEKKETVYHQIWS